MSEETLKTIWIITDETSTISTPTGARGDGQDTGGLLGKYKQPPPQIEVLGKERVAVPVERLKQEMTDFLQVVGDVFSQAEQQQSGLQIDEIELSVEINGEGQVSLFGIGGKAGGKGAIKLKFKRKESN